MEAVFELNERIEWVNGWLTGGTDPADGSVECGDHTPFPLEITGGSVSEKLEKLAEILFRVKFAQITENTLSFSGVWNGGVAASGSTSPRIQRGAVVSAAWSLNYMANGYWTLDEEDYGPYASGLPYLGASYDAEFPGIYNIGGSPAITLSHRDIAAKEWGMWLPPVTGEEPQWNRIAESQGVGSYYLGSGDKYGLDEQYFKTAFTWYSVSDAGAGGEPDIPIPYVTDASMGDEVYEVIEVLVEFSGKVALVGDMGNFYAAANRIFLGVRCRWKVEGLSGAGDTGPLESGFSASAAEYIIRLPSGDIACPFSTTETITGYLVHEPSEWWPYAKGIPATPAWDAATGAPL